LSGHEKIITKSGNSLNAGTLNRGFTVYPLHPKDKTLSCSGDLNNSAPAAAEIWELKGCMLKVKSECGHFILFRWLSLAAKSVFIFIKV
jgi:hypothetical protein